MAIIYLAIIQPLASTKNKISSHNDNDFLGENGFKSE
jgi:hypothetical protein